MSEFPRKFGKYILLKKLAMGGMAEIYRAKTVGAEGFEKDIVIKRILPHYTEDEDFVKMFIDEATIAAKLQHANIVQIFDFNQEEGSYYIAMEYVEGKDLKKLMEDGVKKGDPLSPEQCVWLIMEVAKGLHYAHVKSHKGTPLNIVHRDISPQNAMVSFNGEVKLMDFGIAKAASRSTKTVAGTVKGKCAYMSPEQARGKPLDGRSDLFALGIVLWEMLTHKRLFLGDSDFMTLSNVLKQEVPPPSSINPAVDPAVDAIVLKALSKDRDDRQDTVEQFSRELTKWFYATVDDLDAVALKPWMHRMFSDDLTEIQEQMQAERTMALSLDDVPPVSADDATVALVIGEDPQGAMTLLDDGALNADKVREALAAAQARAPSSQSTNVVGGVHNTGAVRASGGGKGWLIGLLVLILIGGGGFAGWYILQQGDAEDSPKKVANDTDKGDKDKSDRDHGGNKVSDKHDRTAGNSGTSNNGTSDTVKKDSASLAVTLDPKDAKNITVFKNGAPVDGTKLTGLAVGQKLSLKVTADGFRDYEEVVKISKKDQKLSIVLTRDVKMASVVVKTNDPKAIIKADGKVVGAGGVAKISGPVGKTVKIEVTPGGGGAAITKDLVIASGTPLLELKVPGIGGTVAPTTQLAQLIVKCSKPGSKVDAKPAGNVVVGEDGSVAVKGLLIGTAIKVTCRFGKLSGRKDVTVKQPSEEIKIAMKAPAGPRRGPCKITVNAKPWAKCRVGGKGPKTTRFSVELTGPKSYRVTCSKGSDSKSKSVKCTPGKPKTTTFDFR